MYSVEFTANKKRETTVTDATTERVAKHIFTRSLVGAEIHWDTFNKAGAKPFVIASKPSKKDKDVEVKPDVHL